MDVSSGYLDGTDGSSPAGIVSLSGVTVLDPAWLSE